LSQYHMSISNLHSCIHCRDIVVDAVAGWAEPGILLEYTTVSHLLQAYQECLFIKLTLADWKPEDTEQRTRLLFSSSSIMSRIVRRRPRTIQLYIDFRWNLFSMNQSKTLEALELQWNIEGENRKPRPFLVHVKNGTLGSSFL
jgi:hypothetical protein